MQKVGIKALRELHGWRGGESRDITVKLRLDGGVVWGDRAVLATKRRNGSCGVWLVKGGIESFTVLKGGVIGEGDVRQGWADLTTVICPMTVPCLKGGASSREENAEWAKLIDVAE
jgi:hypothetical protein